MPWITGVFWIHPNWRILSIKSFPLTVGVPAHSSSFCPLNCNVEESWVNISASKQFRRKTRAKTHGWTVRTPNTAPPSVIFQDIATAFLNDNPWTQWTFRNPGWVFFHFCDMVDSSLIFPWSLQSTVSPEPKRQVEAVVGLLLIKCKGLRIKSAQTCQRFARQCLSRVVADKAWLNLRATTTPKIRLKYCMFIHILHHIMCIWMMLHHTRISPSMPK